MNKEVGQLATLHILPLHCATEKLHVNIKKLPTASGSSDYLAIYESQSRLSRQVAYLGLKNLY